jgi:t-SNARE domain-containing protein 1
MKQTTPAYEDLDDEVLEPEQQEKQQLLVDTTQLEIAVLVNREERVRQLETDMVDLNSIMCDMAAMAKEQREQVLEIDRNVESSVDNVEEAAAQLQQANRSTSQTRKCLLVFLIVGVVLLILLVYFLLH